MDLIYKVTGREIDGKPVLQQMERHGQQDFLYSLRWTEVHAISLRHAREIQRQYRKEVKK